MLRTILTLALTGVTLSGPAWASACDCPAFAYLHRPYYRVPGLVYIHGDRDRPYVERIYYTPARPPYYSVPPNSVLVPCFGPTHVE
jgi:hypothetical protein